MTQLPLGTTLDRFNPLPVHTGTSLLLLSSSLGLSISSNKFSMEIRFLSTSMALHLLPYGVSDGMAFYVQLMVCLVDAALPIEIWGQGIQSCQGSTCLASLKPWIQSPVLCKSDILAHDYSVSAGEVNVGGSGVHGHSPLHRESETNLDSMRP